MKFSVVRAASAIFVSIILLAAVPCGHAAEDLEPLAKSSAYQEFLKKKPANDLAKMICLLNYFRTAPIVVLFDGTEYTPEAAYPFALVYLMTNYRGEQPERWAKKHCYRSLFTNNIIFVKFKDGTSRPGRDLIIEKYHELEEAQKAEPSRD